MLRRGDGLSRAAGAELRWMTAQPRCTASPVVARKSYQSAARQQSSGNRRNAAGGWQSRSLRNSSVEISARWPGRALQFTAGRQYAENSSAVGPFAEFKVAQVLNSSPRVSGVRYQKQNSADEQGSGSQASGRGVI